MNGRPKATKEPMTGRPNGPGVINKPQEKKSEQTQAPPQLSFADYLVKEHWFIFGASTLLWTAILGATLYQNTQFFSHYVHLPGVVAYLFIPAVFLMIVAITHQCLKHYCLPTSQGEGQQRASDDDSDYEFEAVLHEDKKVVTQDDYRPIRNANMKTPLAFCAVLGVGFTGIAGMGIYHNLNNLSQLLTLSKVATGGIFGACLLLALIGSLYLANQHKDTTGYRLAQSQSLA